MLRCAGSALFCVVKLEWGTLDGNSSACRDSSSIVVGFVGESLVAPAV